MSELGRMWNAIRIFARAQMPPLTDKVRLFHTTAACFRRKDMTALRGKLPPEEEGVEGEKSVAVSQSLPLYPTLETNRAVFDGMVFTDVPIINIKCSQNNTIITVSDAKTGIRSLVLSCGTEGFRNCKKGTNVAGQAVGLAVGRKALATGQRTYRVAIRGLGPGRASSIKGLEMAGINIISITDRTPIPDNGLKPRKARRV